MNDFDRAARAAVKLRREVTLAWFFPRLRGLEFARWQDSQSAPRPGEPERRCDTLAELVDPEGASPPWTVVIELFTEADADALDRGIEYVGRFRREVRHGPYGTDRYHFALVLVFLTTVPEETATRNELPGHEEVLLNVQPRVVALAGKDGVALLDEIEQNSSRRPLLAWASLLKGGQSAEYVARWRRLAEQEGDELLKRTLGDIVALFAQLTDSVEVWRKGLEGFAVRESIIAREWRIEGRVEAHRESLLRVLQVRFPGAPLTHLEPRVQAQEDLDVLKRWFDLAVTARDLEAFEAGLDV